MIKTILHMWYVKRICVLAMNQSSIKYIITFRIMLQTGDNQFSEFATVYVNVSIKCTVEYFLL